MMGGILKLLEMDGLLKMEIGDEGKVVDFIDVWEDEIIFSMNKKELWLFKEEIQLLYYEMKD